MWNYHWSFWIFILLGIIFLFWVFFGGKEQEYVGLDPLIPDFLNHDDEIIENSDGDTNTISHDNNIVTDGDTNTISCDNIVDPNTISHDNDHHDTTDETISICSGDDETILIVTETPQENLIYVYDKSLPNLPQPDKPSRWKRQETCCRSVEEIFGLPFRRDVRDLDWLYNPETGARLELDCYNDELGVAVEHNGQHHYVFPNNFNKTKEDWLNMIRRDQLKPELCDHHGIYLITIPYSVPFNKIKEEIRKQLNPFLETRRHEIK